MSDEQRPEPERRAWIEAARQRDRADAAEASLREIRKKLGELDRFDFEVDPGDIFGGHGNMVEEDDGEYVRFDDVLALLADENNDTKANQ